MGGGAGGSTHATATDEGAADEPSMASASSSSSPGGWRDTAQRLQRLAGNVATAVADKVEGRMANTPFRLQVRLKQLRGTLRVWVGAPPSSRVWFGFVGRPTLSMEATPLLGDLSITHAALATRVSNLLASKLQAKFYSALVLPSCSGMDLSMLLGLDARMQPPPPGAREMAEEMAEEKLEASGSGSASSGGSSGVALSSEERLAALPHSLSTEWTMERQPKVDDVRGGGGGGAGGAAVAGERQQQQQTNNSVCDLLALWAEEDEPGGGGAEERRRGDGSPVSPPPPPLRAEADDGGSTEQRHDPRRHLRHLKTGMVRLPRQQWNIRSCHGCVGHVR